MSKNISPITTENRIISLDILRGFAILGILIMNIQSFSMITAAYVNPTAYGDLTGINKWTWIISHIIADNKFMTIFSILFGAGIVLMSDKIKKAGRKPAGIYYRRIFWLFVIGMVHAYLFWYGDILVCYAMCGLIVFLFRNLKPGWLFFFGVLSLLIGSAIYLFFGTTIEYWPEESLENALKFWAPSDELIMEDLNAYLGSFMGALRHRMSTSIFLQTMNFLMNEGWHAGGLMLMGMAFYKWKILSGERTNKLYFNSFILGALIGIPLVILGVYQNFNHDWVYEYSMFLGSQYNYLGSVFVSYAYICLILLLLKKGKFVRCQKTLSLIGRTALSNYLFQTLICTMLLYGYGMGIGLYGKVERWQMILIAIAVWIIQIALTRYWLKRFRFGPFEWLWRSLTYWKIQALHIDQNR
ncbi:MAG: DUF418 domain-containing protein [Bacteroidales bacterium]|nr:DUF418 domain-containing protein [Bacteroidales bacterium]